MPVLTRGSDGSYVKYAQELLMSAGFILKSFGPDGRFNDETLTEVLLFQKRHKLAMTGEVNSETWKQLLKYDTYEEG